MVCCPLPCAGHGGRDPGQPAGAAGDAEGQGRHLGRADAGVEPLGDFPAQASSPERGNSPQREMLTSPWERYKCALDRNQDMW